MTSTLEQLIEEITFRRRKEMRLTGINKPEFSAHQNTTYWTDLFVRHFLFQTDYEADRDDLLFFIRKTGQNCCKKMTQTQKITIQCSSIENQQSPFYVVNRVFFD